MRGVRPGAAGRVGDEPGVGVLRVRASCRRARATSARRFRSCPRPGRRGSARRCPCRRATTASIRRCIRRAVRALITRSPAPGFAARACARSSVSGRRRPRLAIDAGRLGHLQRRRLHLALADRGRADREVVADRVGLRDRALGDDREGGRAVEAERARRSATRRCRAELRAERREDRVAGDGEGLHERPAADLAAGVRRAGRRRARPGSRTGRSSLELGDAGLERAGGRDHLERRARRLQQRERRARVREHGAGRAGRTRRRRRSGRRARRRRRARAPGRSWCARARRAGPGPGRSRACPASSVPDGRPPSRSSKIALEAAGPDLRVGGHAELRDARGLDVRRSGRACRRPGRRRPGSGTSASAPCASGVPSRAVSVPRSGIVVRRVRRSPSRRPGKTSRGFQSTRRASPSCATGITTAPLTVPKIRVRTVTGTRQRSSPSCSGFPVVTDRSLAVAVASAARSAAGEREQADALPAPPG